MANRVRVLIGRAVRHATGKFGYLRHAGTVLLAPEDDDFLDSPHSEDMVVASHPAFKSHTGQQRTQIIERDI